MTQRLQDIMSAAYDRWTDGMGKDDFWAQLSPDEQVVVAIGNWNYQTENGGMIQWYDNGYATREAVAVLRQTLRALPEPVGAEALALLERFLTAIEWDDYPDPNRRPYPDCEDEDDQPGDIDAVCSPFYELNARLLEAVTAYVDRHFRV